MVSNKKFSISRIRNKTVGEILEETRREQNISLEEASNLTRINKTYLAALESGDYASLPQGVYLEKFIETYADFLNIDFKSLKKILIKEIQINQISAKKKSIFVKKISSRHLIVLPKLIKIFTAFAAIVILMAYLGFEINNIFSPPSLEIFSPIDNLVTTDHNIEVTGQTQKEVKIKINDQEIQSDKAGYFKEFVSLKSGLNIIKISAAKKRSKENIIYRRVILITNE